MMFNSFRLTRMRSSAKSLRQKDIGSVECPKAHTQRVRLSRTRRRFDPRTRRRAQPSVIRRSLVIIAKFGWLLLYSACYCLDIQDIQPKKEWI